MFFQLGIINSILQEPNSYDMPRTLLTILLFVTCFSTTASDNLPNKFRIIDSLIERNQIDSAAICLEEIGKQIKYEKSPILKLAYLHRYAGIQKLKGDFQKVLANYDSISRILPYVKPQTVADSMLVARGYLSAGSLLGNQNRYSEAIVQYQKAILYSQSEPNNQFRSYYFQNIGLCYIRTGQIERGIENVNKAFDIYDANRDYVGKFGCLDYIGSTMVDYQNYGLARKYFRMALLLKDSIKDEFEKTGLFNDIGRMYNYEMKYDSALINFDLALAESSKAKNDYLIAIAQCNIGEVLMKQGYYDKAISSLNLALMQFTSIHFDLGIFQTNHLIAFCEYKRNELKKAELFQNRAEKLMQKTEVYPTLLIDFYKRSHELKKGLGKLQESLAYLEKYQSMQDSVNSRLTNWKINEIESRLLTSVKEKQLVKKESELKQHKSIIRFISTLFLLVSVLTVIIALYIRKRREAHYQKQLSKMTALRMQNARNTMSPHFFFNVLAALNGLSTQPEQLKKKLGSLSLLLRKVIENIDQTAVTLENELEAVKAYIDLYQEKIPHPFTVEYSIADGTDLKKMIPAMIIQIPVENAIKHGLMPLDGEKRLTISITDQDEFQHITVSDNGIGLKAATGRSTGTGTGLKVLMQTIHLLNTKNQNEIKFSVSERDSNSGEVSGTIADIQIPYDFNYTL